MDHELHNKVKGRLVFLSAINTNGTHNAIAIDTIGFDSLEYFISVGQITDGDYDFLLQEDDDSAFLGSTTGSTTPVEQDYILGSTIGFTSTDSFSLRRIGSIGKKRYQRVNIVSTNVSVGANRFCSIAILGDAYVNPVPDVIQLN